MIKINQFQWDIFHLVNGAKSKRTIVINLQPNIHNRQHQCSQAGSLSLRGNLGNEVVVNAAHKILKYKKPVLFCTNQQTGSAATLQNNNNKT